MANRTIAGRGLLLSVGLLLVYLFTRWHNAKLFPYFLDEVILLGSARKIYNLNFFIDPFNGRLFNTWWWGLFDIRFDTTATVWLLRIVTSLWVLIGVALLIRIGRMFGSWQTGWLAAALYTFMPYAFFHDRMVFTDPYVVTWALIAVWGALRYTRRQQRRDALLAGIGLIGVLTAKATGVVLLIIPVLTLFFLGEKLSCRAKWHGGAIIYGVFAVVWVPLQFYFLTLGQGYFKVATTIVGEGTPNGALARLQTNIPIFLNAEIIFFSLPFWIMVIILGLVLLKLRWRWALYWLSIITVPVGGLLFFGTKISTRYFLFHTVFLALALAVGWETLRQYRWMWVRRITTAGFILWVLCWSLPFFYTYFTNPGDIQLPPLDQGEYILRPVGGFAQPIAARYILEQQEKLGQSLTVVVMLVNCPSFIYYIPPDASITLHCSWLWDTPIDQEIAIIEALAKTTPAGTLWIVQEETEISSIKTLQVPITSRAKFYRPDGKTYIEVWQVQN